MGAAAREIAGTPGTGFESRTERLQRELLCLATEPTSGRRVIIVSNRLPVVPVEQHGEYWLRPTSGGLASALRRLHAKSNSLWIGATDADGSLDARDLQLRDRFAAARLAGIPLTEAELADYYRGYANGVLWPVLHGLAARAPADRRAWAMYRSVNERFAEAVAAEWREGDRVWVHDYHLMLLPAMLRARRPDVTIGFFLHTPFPKGHLTALLDWPELAEGITGADVIGFQTRRDACAAAEVFGGQGVEHDDEAVAVACGDRMVRVVTAPIAIDHVWFAERSRLPAVLNQCAGLRVSWPGPLFVGVDRLDYTKGIPERLHAFQRLLDVEPALRNRARFVQVAVPSREGVEGYEATRQEIEQIVAQINRRYATTNWTPVEYRYGSVDANALVALYRAADVMVVTPKCDGMNLVAKEFVASRTDGGGVLVLSRTAGAAEQLRSALLIDPTDVASIMTAYRRALRMSATERRSRMRKLRETVRSRDVFSWANTFLDTLSSDSTTRALDD